MSKLSVFCEAIRIIRKSQVIACHLPTCGQSDPDNPFGPCKCGYADYIAWSQRFLDEHAMSVPSSWASTDRGGEMTRVVFGSDAKEKG